MVTSLLNLCTSLKTNYEINCARKPGVGNGGVLRGNGGLRSDERRRWLPGAMRDGSYRIVPNTGSVRAAHYAQHSGDAPRPAAVTASRPSQARRARSIEITEIYAQS